MYSLTINVYVILPSCGIALKLIGSATRYEFQWTPKGLSIIQLRDVLSTKISCRIFALLQLEMWGPKASRFELQVISHHGMIERGI